MERFVFLFLSLYLIGIAGKCLAILFVQYRTLSSFFSLVQAQLDHPNESQLIDQFSRYLSEISLLSVDPGWTIDPVDGQHLAWHSSPSTSAGKEPLSDLERRRRRSVVCLDKYGFVLKHADDKETLQSSKQSHARLRGTTHLSSRKAPSCLTFTYRVTGNSSNRLIVSISDQAVWSSRLLPGHRLDKRPTWSLLSC